MKIRKIQPQDRAGLKALLEAQEHFTREERSVALELIDIVLTHSAQEDYIIRVAEEPGEGVTGYVCYGKAPLTDAVYDLYWIVVHPAFGRLGTGSSLLHQVEVDLKRRGARLLLIETSSKPSYETARTFYRKHGYKEQVRVLDYYSVGDHKLIFGKNLR